MLKSMPALPRELDEAMGNRPISATGWTRTIPYLWLCFNIPPQRSIVDKNQCLNEYLASKKPRALEAEGRLDTLHLDAKAHGMIACFLCAYRALVSRNKFYKRDALMASNVQGRRERFSVFTFLAPVFRVKLPCRILQTH